jgi:enoyl-CoA hydratase/carnithine racemase
VKKSVHKNSAFKFSHHSIQLGAVRAAGRIVSIGELVFSDHSSRNSFSLETSRELLKILPQIEKTCDALLFRSEGRVFCSGGNLKDQVALGASKSKLANREITKCLTRLSQLSIPTIALVEGDALGGGLELLSAFDSVVATPHAVFGLWQRRMGLSFGWGGGARLKRLMPPGELTRLALESAPLSATEAKIKGFVDHLAPSWSARSNALALALRLASLPQASVKVMKELKQVSAVEARREQIAFEKLWFGPAHKARLAAFRQIATAR